MPPIFLQLFERGRYVSIRSIAQKEAADETGRRTEQRERYCVAAIALVLKHDVDFRAHFLKCIDAVSPRELTGIEIEPHAWSDLLLYGPKHAHIVEFKIGALVQAHQDSTTNEFNKTGYGAKIEQLRCREPHLESVRYTIIGGARSDGAQERKGIRIREIGWERLIQFDDYCESTLVADLFDSLGDLGMPIFITRHMNPDFSSQAAAAITLYDALAGVLQQIGKPGFRSDSGDGCVGYSIRKAGANKEPRTTLGRLAKVVDTERSDLAWIGYERMAADAELQLSIYFYCSARSSKAVKTRLQKARFAPREDGPTIIVRQSVSKQDDHIDWFVTTLESVLPERA